MSDLFTERWKPLRAHPEQYRLWTENKRFRVVPAGRRSGKTELAKRFLVMNAVMGSDFIRPRYAALAPTQDQARRIYWDDLKAMVPPYMILGDPKESKMQIKLINGSELWVIGMDKPARVEGSPWDGLVLDEYANMRKEAWTDNVRPALADRRGWAWLIGVPEGRNHYFQMYKKALADKSGMWGAYTWKSADILPREEVESAREDLDELTFRQEFEADFVTFAGRCYYGFSNVENCSTLQYDPMDDLIFCFDFNVSPGVAAICQEMTLPGQTEVIQENGIYRRTQVKGTGVIGEVWIPQNSNTPAVCRKLIQDWGHHKGRIICYGDATGGAKGTAKVSGSDWTLIKNELDSAGSPFRGRVEFRVPKGNPRERARVNAMNSRIRSATGVIRLMVDDQRAPHVVNDLESVRLVEGGAGDIDKEYDSMTTHISDALGYYVAERFPIEDGESIEIQDF